MRATHLRILIIFNINKKRYFIYHWFSVNIAQDYYVLIDMKTQFYKYYKHLDNKTR